MLVLFSTCPVIEASAKVPTGKSLVSAHHRSGFWNFNQGFDSFIATLRVGTTTVGILISYHILLHFYIFAKQFCQKAKTIQILWPRRVHTSNSDNHRPALAMAPSTLCHFKSHFTCLVLKDHPLRVPHTVDLHNNSFTRMC